MLLDVEGGIAMGPRKPQDSRWLFLPQPLLTQPRPFYGIRSTITLKLPDRASHRGCRDQFAKQAILLACVDGPLSLSVARPNASCARPTPSQAALAAHFSRGSAVGRATLAAETPGGSGGEHPGEGGVYLLRATHLGGRCLITGLRLAGSGQPNPSLLPAHSHSITSSARARRVGGMVRPSACAVLRLIASSYLEACSTGKSAGLAPFRIRST